MKLMEYQASYEAAARVLTVTNQLRRFDEYSLRQ